MSKLSFVLGIGILFCFCNCKSNGIISHEQHAAKFYYSEGHLTKETYDSSGVITTKQYFDKDTSPDGSYIEYYRNGKIACWRWFMPHNQNPLCGVFYNEAGQFDTLKGTPFIDAIVDSGKRAHIKLIDPPNIKFIIGYKEFYKNKEIKRIAYDPIKKDRVSWVNLDEYKEKADHTYMVYFYVMDDSEKKVLYEDSTQIR